jgi:hypothetical protein
VSLHYPSLDDVFLTLTGSRAGATQPAPADLTGDAA